MAWTSTTETVLWAPFVLTKITVVPDSTTATAVSHGGPSTLAPNLVLIDATHSNPTATEITCTTKGTSTVTFDVEGTAARFDAYCFFFPQARQDGQSINSDNDA